MAQGVIAKWNGITKRCAAMRKHRIVQAVLGLTIMAGCASTSNSTNHSTAPIPETTKTAAPAFTPLTLPAATSEGPEREVKVLLDEPHLKVMSIVLRKGTLLPTHNASAPVVIHAMSGAGHVLIGDERVRIDAEHIVSLAPSVSHSVEPDAGTNLVLLIHHIRVGARRDEPHHDHHHAN